jgi:hypothetical protein
MTAERARELFHYDPATGVVRRRVARGNRAYDAVVGSKLHLPRAYSDYLTVWADGRSWLLHHIIVLWMTGELPKEVDHVNRDGLDNRWNNLRVATSSENACNKRRYKNNKSGYKGVAFRKDAGRWCAYVNVNGKRTYLGLFLSAEGAAVARERAATKLHGRFVSL